MVNLAEDSKFAVIEGDEYLSSPLDKRPKFHHYKPHLVILSGIAWDHINVFPTFENYVEQFRIFIDSMENNGEVFYFSGDKELRQLAEITKDTVTKTAYDTHPFEVDNNQIGRASCRERV